MIASRLTIRIVVLNHAELVQSNAGWVGAVANVMLPQNIMKSKVNHKVCNDVVKKLAKQNAYGTGRVTKDGVVLIVLDEMNMIKEGLYRRLMAPKVEKGLLKKGVKFELTIASESVNMTEFLALPEA